MLVSKQGFNTNGMKKLNIDISNFSKGIYLMSLKANQLTKAFKLAKEKSYNLYEKNYGLYDFLFIKVTFNT